MKRFEQKKVLITGAASGIGRATAIRIAKEGGNLALVDINESALQKVKEEIISTFSTKVFCQKCDVSHFDEVEDVIRSCHKELGGIQILSHNAGVLRCYHTHEMSLQQWNEILTINLTGTFNVNRHALPYLLENDRSALVNTSSIAAYYRHPWMSAYSATKGAIVSFTRSLFIEYCLKGLRANCVLPGGIDTPLARSFRAPQGSDPKLLKALAPLNDSPQLVAPEDVAAAIAFLASDDAAHINGTEISIDGGKI